MKIIFGFPLEKEKARKRGEMTDGVFFPQEISEGKRMTRKEKISRDLEERRMK